MQAGVEESDSLRTGRRKRNRGWKKLLVDEKVEVRSLEDGFLGSWHSGTVVACRKESRLVRYDQLLADDGAYNLVETVRVSKAVEGINCVNTDNCNSYRGCIRPTPPKLEFGKLNLPYGLCIDVYYQDSWWEGVIFDRKDGSLERRVFFPDLGDEMNFGIESFRITQDWDELTETWHQRGVWLFLELIEKHEKEKYIPVSVKQLWYDIREKTGFDSIGEWTCSLKPLWEELVPEVIDDNLRIFVNHFFFELDLPVSLEQETGPPTEAFKHPSKVKEWSGSNPLKFSDNLTVENILATSTVKTNSESGKTHPHQPIADEVPDGSTVVAKNVPCDEELCAKSTVTDQKARRQKGIGIWEPADLTIVPGAEFCPNAISDYALNVGSRTTLKVDARKHLKYLGWTIEHMTDALGLHRIRYTSPDGQCAYSLRQLCMALMAKDTALCGNSTHFENSISPPTDQLMVDSSNQGPSEERDVGSELHPEAVEEYLKIRMKEVRERGPKIRIIQQKVKRHLLANGWKFVYRTFGRRRVLEYTSPTGTSVYTLRQACARQLANEKSNALNQLRKGQSNRKLKRKGKINSSSNAFHSTWKQGRGGKTSVGLTEARDRVKDSQGKHCALRSSKRVRNEINHGSTHQNPRTILSWLIDNNVVLPRAKVHYCKGKDWFRMKEGKITRDGIKCNCCGKVFSISSFGVHAGSAYRRPAANLFLEDGRSLLDCQVQANEARQKMEPQNTLHEKWNSGENDYVCSVCHYGGELILCDQCPSSFHKSCLGLQDVPDGDWFCPLCCCGICGQNIINEDSEYSMNDRNISCEQCQCKYHIGCLPNQGVESKLEISLEENWFCREDCKEIYMKLRKLIGKPVSVSGDDLTWTLMKSIKSDGRELDASEIEAWAENHSKLNVALEVMHECFEPIKEPRSQRDLVEDVIFSRESELNRLNFKGFYTILLERNDELIAVATVRIHGKKVAEIPLIGTRFKYRGLGMCRVLMNELEKKLMDLEVERLVLPAVSTVLSTWTTSFGFSKMEKAERQKFLQHTFLDFQDAVMCQKLLSKSSSAEPFPLTAYQPKVCDEDDVDHDDNEYEGCHSKVSPQSSHERVMFDKRTGLKDRDCVKLYKRRKVLCQPVADGLQTGHS